MENGSKSFEGMDVTSLTENGLEKQLGFSEEQFVHFNTVARSLFLQGRWEDASDAYFLLSVVRPLEPAFWIGLGLSEQKRERFEQSQKAFSMAALLQPQAARPCLLLAKALKAAGEAEEALLALDRALRLLDGEGAHPGMRNEAETLKREWEKRG